MESEIEDKGEDYCIFGLLFKLYFEILKNIKLIYRLKFFKLGFNVFEAEEEYFT